MNRRWLAVAGMVFALATTACDWKGSSVPESMSTPRPTFTSPSAPPKDKYVGNFPDCEQLTRQVPGLPPVLADNRGPGQLVDQSLFCHFHELGDKPTVLLNLMVWQSDRSSRYDSTFPPEVGRGRARARSVFESSSIPAYNGPVENLGVGEKAKWQRLDDKASCHLSILDENAVLLLTYTGAGKPDPRSEECRGPLRALAKPFYDALQPK